MMAVWEWVDTIHNLAWGMRFTYIALVAAAFLNLTLIREKSLTTPWRRAYAFKGIVAFMALTYYTLLLLGVIDYQDFVLLTRWIQPLVIFSLCTSALLHRWEKRQLRERKALEDRLKNIIEDREDR